MLLVTHIVIALSSVVFTSYLYFVPSKLKFFIAYALIGMTLLSGTILVVMTHSALLASCMTGLVYLGVVLCGLAAANYRLAARDQER